MLELHKDKIPSKLLKFFEPAKCGVCYVCRMVDIFAEVKRVLKYDGTLFLNLGDTYIGGGRGFDSPKQMTNKGTEGIKNLRLAPMNGLKAKDLVGIPWMVAFALRTDGWYLRQDIIWHKPNPMPESVTDRCTKSHEYIFLMSKSAQYYFDNEAIKEPYTKPMNRWGGQKLKANGKSDWDKGTGQSTYRDRDMRPDPNGRNKRSVWTVTTKPYSGAHFATFPPDLILPCILAGCPAGGTILDPFMGAGTTALVAKKNNCNYVGCELNQTYIEIAQRRLSQEYLFT